MAAIVDNVTVRILAEGFRSEDPATVKSLLQVVETFAKHGNMVSRRGANGVSSGGADARGTGQREPEAVSGHRQSSPPGSQSTEHTNALPSQERKEGGHFREQTEPQVPDHQGLQLLASSPE